jgi:hypothetical protein
MPVDKIKLTNTILPQKVIIVEIANIRRIIREYCNEMTIRLTPAEFDKLVNMYVERYIKYTDRETISNLASIITNKA